MHTSGDSIKDLVAVAISHICGVVRSHCEKESILAAEGKMDHQSDKAASATSGSAIYSIDDFPPTPTLSLMRSRSGGGNGGKQNDFRSSNAGIFFVLKCKLNF